MSIKIKTFIIINIFFILGLIVVYMLSQVILGNNIDKQEKRLADENTDRASIIINREIESLSSTCGDWSFWDDTYYFLKRNKIY